MNSFNFSGFNDHHKLAGCHALLGASQWHWINYDKEKLLRKFINFKAAEKGTELHDFAKRCIELRQKLPHSEKTLNMYVNDAIGFRMIPEVVLFYSPICFGTADAICFREDLKTGKMILRIHDYKSGENPASMNQLRLYAAIFCLEYHINPYDILIELRIYQNDKVIYERPEPKLIFDLTEIIREDEKFLSDKMKEAE